MWRAESYSLRLLVERYRPKRLLHPTRHREQTPHLGRQVCCVRGGLGGEDCSPPGGPAWLRSWPMRCQAAVLAASATAMFACAPSTATADDRERMRRYT